MKSIRSKSLKGHCRRFCNILPFETSVIVKTSIPEDSPKKQKNDSENEPNPGGESRINEVNIQMISKNLYTQLFKAKSQMPDLETANKFRKELQCHGVDISTCGRLPDVFLNLPKLQGEDIEDHFLNLGMEQSEPYKNLLLEFVAEGIPQRPKKWLMEPGWVCYKEGKPPEKVPFPAADALIFDVEVLMSAGTLPTLACAVSSDAWFGWVSESLISANKTQKDHNIMKYDDLIPLETDSDESVAPSKPRVVIGHNVSFDRAKVREQYWLQKTALRFMDTMSMHVCVSGVTSYQRAVLKSKEKDPDEINQDWMDISSLNSLQEVYKLYCGGTIPKEPRNIFVTGNRQDVLDNFQHLMQYCSGDVLATYEVLVKLLPLFLERFPHPATLAGMLEIGIAYLPVNSNWLRYIESAETSFEDIKLEIRQLLSMKADKACSLLNNELYKKDLWLWDQDWTVQKLKLKKGPYKVTNDKSYISKIIEENCEVDLKSQDFIELSEEVIKAHRLEAETNEFANDLSRLEDKFCHLYELGKYLPLKRPHLAGYPAWYRKFCTKPDNSGEWTPGANDISTSMQITPKLLNLSWEGYPVHHIKDEGWGFLVPFSHKRPANYLESDEPKIPLEELLVKCPVASFDITAKNDESQIALSQLDKNIQKDLGKRAYYARKKLDENVAKYSGLGVWCNKELEGCVHFLRLPHKDGPKYNVGNPLARDFLDKFSQNVLSAKGNEAEKVLKFGRMLSYWRNNRQRIMKQQVVWLPDNLLPPTLRGSHVKYGAILPQVVVCGTLTRRAMEPTWMTASNAHSERIGSELRGMVQAPPGYTFVGADVDSQELWIASLLGDASVGVIGGTALGWAVLGGAKQHGTDLHSLSARAAGVSRDHAKVINYARIYGAGQNFAERLLKQFNPTITNAEAKHKAMKMFRTTKGTRVYRLKPKYVMGLHEDECDVDLTAYQAFRLAKLSGKSVDEMFEKPKWVGGTESEMFNKLEEISESEQPSTAFLSGRLSRALENSEGRWVSTRLNWAVQSAAADFLHLMLVSMAWLNSNNVRFSLSFHDEVRYLVPEELKYEAAMALQITNLFTRAFCTKRVGLEDLPMSVAFFSSVEIDKVLRKESNMDCVTPSNPHGLEKNYNIPPGESLSIYDLLDKTENI